MDSYKENKQTNAKFNVEKEADEIFGEMREATTEEELMVKNYIDSISTDKGICEYPEYHNGRIYIELLNCLSILGLGENLQPEKIFFDFEFIPVVFVYKKSTGYLLGVCTGSPVFLIEDTYTFLIADVDKDILLKVLKDIISVDKAFEDSKKKILMVNYSSRKNRIVLYREVNFNEIPEGEMFDRNTYLNVTEKFTDYINELERGLTNKNYTE